MTNPILTCLSPETVAARITARMEVREDGCWAWLGRLDRYGYGAFMLTTEGGKRQTGAHRAAWLSMRGDIPAGLQVDHLCRNRSCVNPDHMEIVTNQVNCQRADQANKGRKVGSAPGCSRHGMSHGRTRVNKDGYSRWDCQTCAASRKRKFVASKREARAALTA